MEGSQNFKSRSRDPFRTQFSISFVSTPGLGLGLGVTVRVMVRLGLGLGLGFRDMVMG